MGQQFAQLHDSYVMGMEAKKSDGQDVIF